ncbi:MAG: hypothetical protein IPJ50_07875 [Betaproteobacteria bacterium]|jgi:hypothetical protein|nr:hypothetical protein [Betaproteobacteria bacterium]
MQTNLSKSEIAVLRECVNEAWEAELHDALEGLFEDFSCWADDGYSSMELAERIHEFHDGISRELYKRYTGFPPSVAVARAIALGIIDEAALSPSLQDKLADEIEAQRRINDVD